MKSDKVIFKNVLNTGVNLAVLDKGKQVHACIVKAALESLVFVENAFVDMYSKSQSLQDVHQAFDNISICDLVSWSKVILAYMPTTIMVRRLFSCLNKCNRRESSQT
jgi:hypothetical protein